MRKCNRCKYLTIEYDVEYDLDEDGYENMFLCCEKYEDIFDKNNSCEYFVETNDIGFPHERWEDAMGL